MDIQRKKLKSEEYFLASPFWAKAIHLSGPSLDQYFDLIDSLPENIKDVVSSANTADTLFTISKKNNLSNFQINRLAIEAMKLMTGQTPINQFIQSAAQALNIDQENAKKIAQEINVRIFSQAALQIKKLHENNGNTTLDRYKEIEKKVMTPSAPTSNIHAPQERTVNLQKATPKTPYETSGPQIEGNVVDLSR